MSQNHPEQPGNERNERPAWLSAGSEPARADVARKLDRAARWQTASAWLSLIPLLIPVLIVVAALLVFAVVVLLIAVT